MAQFKSSTRRNSSFSRTNRGGRAVNYPRSTLARSTSPSDYGVDNYSYDEVHLAEWEVPKNILERLPTELQKPAGDWPYAGASLCSSLERIKKLDDESIYRGYPEPEHSTHPHLSRRVSNAQWTTTTAGAGIDTPPMSSPPSSTPASFASMPLSLLPLDPTSSNGFAQRQPIGMESPPFTPVDSMTCPTPEYPQSIPFAANEMPDVHALTRQLSPISMRGRGDSTTSSYTTPMFDESAWDVYLNTFKAEMDDIQHNAMPRLKGYVSTIDKLCAEYSRVPEFKGPIMDFNVWWAANKGQAVQCEKKVRELELPSLDHMRKERLSLGLSI